MPRHLRNRVPTRNVSQNRGVSPESVEKACHAPCFQNAVQKSALDFLGIPFLRAFSHKELMGYFDAYSGFLVRNPKSRPMCTRLCTPRPRDLGVTVPAAFRPGCPRRSRAARQGRANGLLAPREPEGGPDALGHAKGAVTPPLAGPEGQLRARFAG